MFYNGIEGWKRRKEVRREGGREREWEREWERREVRGSERGMRKRDRQVVKKNYGRNTGWQMATPPIMTVSSCGLAEMGQVVAY